MSAEDIYAPVRRFADVPGAPVPLASLIIGLIIIEAVWVIGSWAILPDYDMTTDSTWVTVALLSTFAFMLFGTFFVVRRLQGRPPATLFGPLPAALRDAFACGRLLAVFLLIVNVVLPFDIWTQSEFGMQPIAWVLLLPITLGFLLMQVTAEEVVFRGYLLQGLAARFQSPFAWMVVPSVLFGLGHLWSADSPAAAAQYVIWTTAFGLACADLTGRTGNLGAAIMLHFMTNLFSVALISPVGPIGGLALFQLPAQYGPEDVSTIGLAFDLVWIWMAWMVCRIALRR
ncbi:MAG: CPBP family intramembrane glutamic endopeptidase [Pseudomonadota bacterium]